jgi:hypothetical protein
MKLKFLNRDIIIILILLLVAFLLVGILRQIGLYEGYQEGANTSKKTVTAQLYYDTSKVTQKAINPILVSVEGSNTDFTFEVDKKNKNKLIITNNKNAKIKSVKCEFPRGSQSLGYTWAKAALNSDSIQMVEGNKDPKKNTSMQQCKETCPKFKSTKDITKQMKPVGKSTTQYSIDCAWQSNGILGIGFFSSGTPDSSNLRLADIIIEYE